MEEKTIKLIVDYNEIEKARNFFQDFLKEKGVVLEDIVSVEIVIAELLANAIEHGVKQVEKSIDFFVKMEEKSIVLGVSYYGDIITEEQFDLCINPEEINNIDELKACGRGVFMMHSMMDEVKYIKDGEKAKIYLKKKIK